MYDKDKDGEEEQENRIVYDATRSKTTGQFVPFDELVINPDDTEVVPINRGKPG